MLMLYSSGINAAECWAIWLVLSMDTVAQRSGYVNEYIGKNYMPVNSRTPYAINKQANSKLSCLFGCLYVNGCVMTVFNQTNSRCMLYDIYPNVKKELLPDRNIIVSVLLKSDIHSL